VTNPQTTPLSYRVLTGDRAIRHGFETAWNGTAQSLADELARICRATRPDAAGPLTIHVWTARDAEHYRQPVPADAERFEYPAAAPSTVES
jgi:hypothetical protein